MNAGAMINVRPAHVSMAMRNMSEPNREVILRVWLTQRHRRCVRVAMGHARDAPS
tara:strand:+ start:494 stop:658 length:165 start_codon:yes stop_codon:yes gene_type:complete